MSDRRSSFASLAALTGVLVVYVAVSTWWMDRNGFWTRPPAYDEAAYLRYAQRDLDALEAGGVVALVREAHAIGSPHPPLLHMSAAAVGHLLGGGMDRRVMWWTSTLWALLFLLGSWRLARSFTGPAAAAGVAALTASLPAFMAFGRTFMPQLPMSAAVLWALDALVRSRSLTRPLWTLACGFWAGVATYMKMLAPLYLGGSLAAALVIGLARAETRRRTLLLAGLGLFVCCLVAGPWYFGHRDQLLHYTEFVVGEEGQQSFSRGLPLWSRERWLYYPREAVNNGFGFPLAVAVLLGLLTIPLRRRRGTAGHPDRPGLVLAAGLLVGFPALVYGQTAAHSQYVLGWLPLGLIVAVRSVELVRRPAVRTALVFALAIMGLWNLFLASRSIDEDRARWTWHGIELVGRADPFLAAIGASAGVTAAPGGESWPNEEFARTVLEQSLRDEPRVGWLRRRGRHAYFNRDHLRLHADRAGRRIVSVDLDWRKQAAMLPELGTVDFVILDNIGRPSSEIVDLLDVRTPLSAELLADVAVNDRIHFGLVAIRRPWERDRYVSASDLAGWPAQPAAADFGGGWKLRATELTFPKYWTPIVTTYWEPAAEREEGWDLVARLLRASDGRHLATRREPLRAPPPPPFAGAIMTQLVDGFDVGDERGPFQLRLTLRRRAGPVQIDDGWVVIDP